MPRRRGAKKKGPSSTSNKHQQPTNDEQSDNELLDELVAQNQKYYDELERQQKEEKERRERMNTPATDVVSDGLAWMPSLHTRLSTMLPECKPLLNYYQDLDHEHQKYVMLTNYKQGVRLVVDTNGAFVSTRTRLTDSFTPTTLCIHWSFLPTKGYIDVLSPPTQVMGTLYALMPTTSISMDRRAEILFLFALRWIRQWMLPPYRTTDNNEISAKNVNVSRVYYSCATNGKMDSSSKRYLDDPTPEIIDSVSSLRRNFRLRL